MFCRNCGKQLPDGCKFCAYCGKSTETDPQPPLVVPVLKPAGSLLSEEPPKPKKPAEPPKPKKPAEPIAPIPSSPKVTPPSEPRKKSDKKNPGKKIFWIIFCSALAIIALLAVGFSLLQQDSSKSNKSNKTSEPETLSAAEKYYSENSEIVSIVDAETSDEVLTEAQVKTLLEERGFIDYPITYEYSADGTYVDQAEISESSSAKHPMYQTFYTSATDELWVIYVINGSIFANPVTYNLESDSNIQTIISESNILTSYDDTTNKFYTTKPYANAIIVKNIGTINANTLDNLTMEAISQL